LERFAAPLSSAACPPDGGKIVHSYNDHASVVKFIERNWHLSPLTKRSRDNLLNPQMDPQHPYVPTNMPAVGDLFDMFNFSQNGQGNQGNQGNQ
jgi:phospholipase C